MKNSIIKKALAVTIIFFALIAVPKIFVHDSIEISKKELKQIKSEAKLLFSNPVEKIIIQSIEVKKGINSNKIVNAYTLGGLKYAVAEIDQNKSYRVVWRLLFGK